MRTLPAALLGLALLAGQAGAQEKQQKEPVLDGRPLSAWIADLKAPSPQTRNFAAYTIGTLGPDGKAAVPALIEALSDSNASVRFRVCVALEQMGPAAAEAAPALNNTLDDMSDDVAAAARRALIKITGKDPGRIGE
ncbi:MAG TPA: HEAT repeat domain-containing protein [Gemmatimonadales bacterium]|nr:HEAT repeat domain-containing protein [Gemmatimonadales bacterium]